MIDACDACSKGSIGYTISRAILSDAIALTRGDRYFTHDFTPFNLTSWGFADCQRKPDAFGFGSTMGRLFLRTLPNHFTENSAYAFFPFMTPTSMGTNLGKLGLVHEYDLVRPATKKETAIIQDYATVASILKDQDAFVAPYRYRVNRVLSGSGYVNSLTDCLLYSQKTRFFPIEREQAKQAVLAVLDSPELVEQIGQYFYESTQKLITAESYTLVGGKISGVDVVRQVLRVVPIYWVANDLVSLR